MVGVEAGQFVEVGGLKTYYIHKGQGPNVVMLHGSAPGACWSTVWGANLDPIADAGYSVWALDEAGFGRTDNPKDFAFEGRISHVQAFLAAMGLDRYTLWGHSDGSFIGCAIALQDPRVEALVLQASGSLSPPDPNGPREGADEATAARRGYQPSMESARSQLEHSMANKAAITDELVREFYEASTGKNVEAYQGRLQAKKERIYDKLGGLKVPVLMLWGTEDSGGPGRGLALFERIPGAELHIFSDCGHWIQRDKTERVHALVLDFLRSH